MKAVSGGCLGIVWAHVPPVGLYTSSAFACTSGSSRKSWKMLGTFWTNLAWLACVLHFSLSLFLSLCIRLSF